MTSYDVYSYGVIASSTLYLLKEHFPAKSGYAEFTRKFKNIGGEAANTSLVLSRLGISVKLDGNWINPDDDAGFIKDVFNRHQVDISRISFQKCCGPKEMLVVDSSSRTIFGTYSQLLREESWNLPKELDVQNARIVCLDPFFGQASRQVAEYAKKHKRTLVTVDCKLDDPVFLASDVVIISEEYLRDAYPNHQVAEITHAHIENANGIVIFTFGHKEIIYGSKDRDFRTFTPYQIDPVDTTGAGDSFRAGIIYGLLKGWGIEKMIEFSSALAALVCRSFPGVLNSPEYSQVTSFMENHKAN